MTQQTLYSALRKEYSKSNTLRRINILKKYGFNTEEEYINFLNYQLKKIELKNTIKDISKQRENKVILTETI